MRNKHVLWLFIFLSLGSLAMIGCVPSGTTPILATPSQRQPPTSPPTLITPHTQTPIPLSPTPTQVFVKSTPTLTLTLSIQARPDYLTNLLATNQNCQLPCWWGITPGQTSWQEAYKSLSPLGSIGLPHIRNGVKRYELSLTVPKTTYAEGYIEPVIYVKDDIVTAIALNSSWVRSDFKYSLAGLLNTFGVPDEIWLEIDTDTMFEPSYDIVLFYASRGFFVSADGNAQERGDVLRICPQKFRISDKFPPGLMLWSPLEKITYKTLGPSLLGGYINQSREGLFLLEELTNSFGREDFYEVYRDPKTTACFDINRANLP